MAMDSVPRGLLKRFRAPAPSRRRPEGREMVVFDHDVRLTGSWRRRSWRRGWGTAQPLRARRRKVPKRLRARSSSWGSPICLGRSTSRSTDWPGSSERRIGSRSTPSLNNTLFAIKQLHDAHEDSAQLSSSEPTGILVGRSAMRSCGQHQILGIDAATEEGKFETKAAVRAPMRNMAKGH